MISRKHKNVSGCPRCRSIRMERRLDGSRWCARCGQRISRDGRLIPSADRRGKDIEPDDQLILI